MFRKNKLENNYTSEQTTNEGLNEYSFSMVFNRSSKDIKSSKYLGDIRNPFSPREPGESLSSFWLDGQKYEYFISLYTHFELFAGLWNLWMSILLGYIFYHISRKKKLRNLIFGGVDPRFYTPNLFLALWIYSCILNNQFLYLIFIFFLFAIVQLHKSYEVCVRLFIKDLKLIVSKVSAYLVKNYLLDILVKNIYLRILRSCTRSPIVLYILVIIFFYIGELVIWSKKFWQKYSEDVIATVTILVPIILGFESVKWFIKSYISLANLPQNMSINVEHPIYIPGRKRESLRRLIGTIFAAMHSSSYYLSVIFPQLWLIHIFLMLLKLWYKPRYTKKAIFLEILLFLVIHLSHIPVTDISISLLKVGVISHEYVEFFEKVWSIFF